MDALKDLKKFLIVMAILGIVWLFTGGPLRPNAKSGWWLFKPQQQHSGKAQKQIKLEEQISGRRASSSSAAPEAEPDILEIRKGRATETDPNEEFIEIRAPRKNKNPYRLTGLAVEGRNGLEITIGKGAKFFFADVIAQPEEDIFLLPGEKAVVLTGRSQLGVSFQLTKCTGYFEQHRDFTPKLPLNCPLPREENLPSNLNDDCLDFIDGLPRCKTVASVPPDLSSFCNAYVNEKINYKTCSEVHKSDSDYYKPEWRVFLGRDLEMWKNSRETITLKDSRGKLIDSISY
ncbi:MAG: hypothetical protein L6Q29_03245 [Candidatus Pacebacteria bacterium]|nr:hypothetical protein [Candidatus Paceibacterota bacterium]NUQ57429.1 hypothetical protein [Candidatus Paceibacter sp.]